MSALTKDQWQELEQRLSHSFGTAHLMVDGYKLSLQLAKEKPNSLKYVILWFCNGGFEGKWLLQDCEERRRFARAAKTYVWSPNERARLTKGFTKKALEKHFPDINKTITVYNWHWRSFKPFMRHLLANNKSIELLP